MTVKNKSEGIITDTAYLKKIIIHIINNYKYSWHLTWDGQIPWKTELTQNDKHEIENINRFINLFIF